MSSRNPEIFNSEIAEKQKRIDKIKKEVKIDDKVTFTTTKNKIITLQVEDIKGDRLIFKELEPDEKKPKSDNKKSKAVTFKTFDKLADDKNLALNFQKLGETTGRQLLSKELKNGTRKKDTVKIKTKNRKKSWSSAWEQPTITTSATITQSPVVTTSKPSPEKPYPGTEVVEPKFPGNPLTEKTGKFRLMDPNEDNKKPTEEKDANTLPASHQQITTHHRVPLLQPNNKETAFTVNDEDEDVLTVNDEDIVESISYEELKKQEEISKKIDEFATNFEAIEKGRKKIKLDELLEDEKIRSENKDLISEYETLKTTYDIIKNNEQSTAFKKFDWNNFLKSSQSLNNKINNLIADNIPIEKGGVTLDAEFLKEVKEGEKAEQDKKEKAKFLNDLMTNKLQYILWENKTNPDITFNISYHKKKNEFSIWNVKENKEDFHSYADLLALMTSPYLHNYKIGGFKETTKKPVASSTLELSTAVPEKKKKPSRGFFRKLAQGTIGLIAALTLKGGTGTETEATGSLERPVTTATETPGQERVDQQESAVRDSVDEVSRTTESTWENVNNTIKEISTAFHGVIDNVKNYLQREEERQTLATDTSEAIREAQVVLENALTNTENYTEIAQQQMHQSIESASGLFTDVTNQIKRVFDTLENIGVIMDSSFRSILNEVENSIQQLRTGLTELNQNIQSESVDIEELRRITEELTNSETNLERTLEQLGDTLSSSVQKLFDLYIRRNEQISGPIAGTYYLTVQHGEGLQNLENRLYRDYINDQLSDSSPDYLRSLRVQSWLVIERDLDPEDLQYRTGAGLTIHVNELGIVDSATASPETQNRVFERRHATRQTSETTTRPPTIERLTTENVEPVQINENLLEDLNSYRNQDETGQTIRVLPNAYNNFVDVLHSQANSYRPGSRDNSAITLYFRLTRALDTDWGGNNEPMFDIIHEINEVYGQRYSNGNKSIERKSARVPEASSPPLTPLQLEKNKKNVKKAENFDLNTTEGYSNADTLRNQLIASRNEIENEVNGNRLFKIVKFDSKIPSILGQQQFKEHGKDGLMISHYDETIKKIKNKKMDNKVPILEKYQELYFKLIGYFDKLKIGDNEIEKNKQE